MPKICLNELFPEKVIEERKALIDSFWRGADIGRPVIVPVVWDNKPWPDRSQPRTHVEVFIDKLRYLARAPVDMIPCYEYDVGGTVTLASAFGGNSRLTDNGKYWIDPIIKSPEDVYKISPPPVTAGYLGQIVQRYAEVLDAIDGHIPIGMPDMQGPLQTAGMIWGEQEFILAMYEDPKAVHHLLNLVTDHIIAVAKYLRTNFTDTHVNCYPPGYLPQDLGQGLIEDFTHLLSPDLYEEFGLPYVNRISDTFNGVWVHCCARFKQHWPVFKKIHNLRGIDTMYPFTSPDEICAEFPDIVHSFGLDFAESQRRASDFGGDGFLKFLVERIPRKTKWMELGPVNDPDAISHKLEFINKNWR